MDGKINPGAAGNVSQDCGPDADEAIASSLDLQVIRVELSERRTKRGDCFPVAACSFATVKGTAAPICNLARKLLALGVDPARHLSIWRGETKCFHDVSVVRPPSRVSESVHSADYSALRGMHQLANEHGISVLVVHHVRKADAEDPFDTVSGSTGLTGAADSTLILTRRESDSGVILYGRGRDLEEFERGLEFDRDDCRWRDLGDPVEAFASDTRQAILAAIRAGNYTPAKIRDFTDVDHELVKKTLQRMARSGDIRRTGRGEYEISSNPLSPVSPCPLGQENDAISKPSSSEEKGQPGTPCPYVPDHSDSNGDTGTHVPNQSPASKASNPLKSNECNADGDTGTDVTGVERGKA